MTELKDTTEILVVAQEDTATVIPSNSAEMKAYQRRPWAPEEDVVLKAMIAEGKSFAEVGYALIRSSYSARARANRLGLNYVFAEREIGIGNRTADVINCLRQGMTYLQISKRYNVSRGKVAGWIHRLRNTPGIVVPEPTAKASTATRERRTVHKSVASARKRARERLKKQIEKDLLRAKQRSARAGEPKPNIKRPWATPVQLPLFTDEPRPDEPLSLRVAVVDLEPHHCRYVHGDPKAEHHCCGHNTRKNSVYCDFHHKLCYTTDASRVRSWVYGGMASSIRLRHFLR